MEYEMILDFSDKDITEDNRMLLIDAIINGKKIKTDVTYFGEGTYNSLYGDLFSLDFNTNTLIDLADEMGFDYNCGDYSDEEMDEIFEDIEKNGYEDAWDEYEKESIGTFV